MRRPRICYRNYGPVVKYLARAQTIFLIDDSMIMSNYWREVEFCVTHCIAAIIDQAETDFVPAEDFFPYEEISDYEDTDDEDDESIHRPEFPNMSLQFLRSHEKLSSIIYTDMVTQIFESVMPHVEDAPIGDRILDILHELFPKPRLDTSEEVPVQIIILTAGYTTDEPEENVNEFFESLDELNITDEKFNITMIQLGSCLGAAAKLEEYELVYNTSDTRQNLVHTQSSLSCDSDSAVDEPLNPRKVFKAVSNGLEIRGAL